MKKSSFVDILNEFTNEFNLEDFFEGYLLYNKIINHLYYYYL